MFNGHLHHELLDIEAFETLAKAKFLAEDFRIDCNANRPIRRWDARGSSTNPGFSIVVDRWMEPGATSYVLDSEITSTESEVK